MKLGYIRKSDAENVLVDRLKSQGAEIVFVENDAKNILPAVLNRLEAGDALYLFDIWHLSRNTSKLETILNRLQSNKVHLIVDGKYLDLEDKQTQFEIRHAMEQHNEIITAFKKDMDAFKEWKNKRKTGE